MRKLTLTLDDLEVSSFVASDAASTPAGGTVHGRARSGNPNCFELDPTITAAIEDAICVAYSLQETCGLSCGGTCLPEDCDILL